MHSWVHCIEGTTNNDNPDAFAPDVTRASIPPPVGQPAELLKRTTGPQRQAMARDAFIVSCLDSGLHPDLSAVKWDTGSVGLDHFGIGDQVAEALAARWAGEPLVGDEATLSWSTRCGGFEGCLRRGSPLLQSLICFAAR